MSKPIKRLIIFFASIIFALSVVAFWVGRETKGFDDMPKVDSSLHVHDLAGYLTGDQKKTLERYAQKISDSSGYPLVIVLTDDNLGRKPKVYSMDFYHANNYGVGQEKSGMIFVVNRNERKIDMRTFGEVRKIFNKHNTNYVLDVAVEALLADDTDVYGSSEDFVAGAQYIYDEWYAYIDQHGKPPVSVLKTHRFNLPIPVFLLIGFGLATAVVLIILFFHKKSIPQAVSAHQYMVGKKPNYSESKDSFIRSYTNRTVRVDKSSSGGGGGGGASFSGGSSSGGSSGGSRSF